MRTCIVSSTANSNPAGDLTSFTDWPDINFRMPKSPNPGEVMEHERNKNFLVSVLNMIAVMV